MQNYKQSSERGDRVREGERKRISKREKREGSGNPPRMAGHAPECKRGRKERKKRASRARGEGEAEGEMERRREGMEVEGL